MSLAAEASPTEESANPVVALLASALERQAAAIDAVAGKVEELRSDLSRTVLFVGASVIISQLINASLVGGSIWLQYDGTNASAQFNVQESTVVAEPAVTP